MKIRLTPRDIIALNTWYTLKLKANWVSVFILTCVLVYQNVPRAVWDVRDYLIALLLGVTIFVIVMLILLLLGAVVALVLSFFNTAFEEKEMVFNNEFIDSKGKRKNKKVLWSDVRGLSLTDNYIFIKISWLEFFIVPARLFDNQYEFAQYYADLHCFLHQARSENILVKDKK